MANILSQQVLGQGFDIKGRVRDNRNQQQENQIAQLLRSQQLKNAQGAGQGIQLQNEARRLQNANAPQQADLDRRIGEAELKRFNTPQQPKLSALQEKIQIATGIPFGQMSREQKQMGYQLVTNPSGQQGPTAAEQLNREKFDYQKQQDKAKALLGPKQKPLTADQAKATGFYDRMIASQKELDTLPEDFQPHSAGEALQGSLGNWAASKDKQRYNQASADWIRAKLRKESGAVIGDDEMDKEFEVYFPVFGDKPEVIEQKARARKIAEEAMFKASGQTAETETIEVDW